MANRYEGSQSDQDWLDRKEMEGIEKLAKEGFRGYGGDEEGENGYGVDEHGISRGEDDLEAGEDLIAERYDESLENVEDEDAG